MQCILCVYKSGVEIVDLPTSDKKMVTLVQRESHVVRHRSSEDLQVHSRDLESIILHPRVECVDGVLQVTVLRAVLAHHCLPSSFGHCLSIGHSRSGTCVHTEHLISIEYLHDAIELHVP
jgi:hypothetical protein